MKYINKTVYTEEIYRRISYQKSFSYELISFKGIALSAAMWLGVRFVTENNKDVNAWIYCGVVCIILPIIFFVYPALRPKSMYKQSLKATGGKQLTNEIVLDTSDIVCRNNVGQKIMRKYEQVTEIRKNKHLIILLSNKFDPIYMDINGFTNCTADEAMDYLNSKCINVKK